VIQVSGEGYRMHVRSVIDLCKHHENFRKALFGYTGYTLQLASRSVACNSYHSIVQRLARWLLFAHDRAGKADFYLTHEVLSAMLAATRPRVSQAAAKLKAEGIIDYRRGKVRILGRERLESVSCECYEETKRQPLPKPPSRQ
jgi:CRP-like cAMP-binding protein